MELRALAKLDPASFVVHNNLGALYMQLRRYLEQHHPIFSVDRAHQWPKRPGMSLMDHGVMLVCILALCLINPACSMTQRRRPHAYLVYDGNDGTVKESATMRDLSISRCPHFSDVGVGDPVLVEL